MGQHQRVGMFDYYAPASVTRCPRCGELLRVWQGKGGPRLLLLWREGSAEPVDQLVDEECKGEWELLRPHRLPPVFEFYIGDAQHDWITALGWTDESRRWVGSGIVAPYVSSARWDAVAGTSVGDRLAARLRLLSAQLELGIPVDAVALSDLGVDLVETGDDSEAAIVAAGIVPRRGTPQSALVPVAKALAEVGP